MLTFETTDEGPIWRIKVKGVVSSLKELEGLEAEVIGVALNECAKRILLDETELSFDTEALDMGAFADQAGGRDVSMRIHVACLASQENLDLNTAFEAAYVNRTIRFKVFEKDNEAISWLMS